MKRITTIIAIISALFITWLKLANTADITGVDVIGVAVYYWLPITAITASINDLINNKKK